LIRAKNSDRATVALVAQGHGRSIAGRTAADNPDRGRHVFRHHRKFDALGEIRPAQFGFASLIDVQSMQPSFDDTPCRFDGAHSNCADSAGPERAYTIGMGTANIISPTGNPDIDTVVIDSEDYFAAPGDVLSDLRFTLGEKRRILESWALDARLLLEAEFENMRGTDPPRLREVRLALLELKKRH
jgi:hypothetical protein